MTNSRAKCDMLSCFPSKCCRLRPASEDRLINVRESQSQHQYCCIVASIYEGSNLITGGCFSHPYVAFCGPVDVKATSEGGPHFFGPALRGGCNLKDPLECYAPRRPIIECPCLSSYWGCCCNPIWPVVYPIAWLLSVLTYGHFFYAGECYHGCTDEYCESFPITIRGLGAGVYNRNNWDNESYEGLGISTSHSDCCNIPETSCLLPTCLESHKTQEDTTTTTTTSTILPTEMSNVETDTQR